MVGLGMVRLGKGTNGPMVAATRFVARHGLVWLGAAWCGWAWHGLAWEPMAHSFRRCK